MLWQNECYYTNNRYPISTYIFQTPLKVLWLLVFTLLKAQIHRTIYIMTNLKESCPYYGTCGSCKLYNLSYSEQLDYKKQRVIQVFEKLNRSLLNEINGDSLQFDISKITNPVSAPSKYHYRNKMEFTFFKKNGATCVGYHESGQFNKFVEIDDCLLMKAENKSILKATKDWANKNKIESYNKKTHKGVLRYLMIRNSNKTKETIVTLVTSDGSAEMFEPLIAELKSCVALKGFVWAKHSEFADVASLKDSTLLYGEDSLIDSIGDKDFIIPFDSFFQVNNETAKLLYDKIYSYVKENDNVIDLFCGAGTISTYIADEANHILGIEIVDSAIAQAKDNMKLNGIPTSKAEFVAGRVREELSKIRFENEYNLIILDPPRSGTDKHTMRHIGKRQPERIVYVACGLGELAYNLKSVMEFGYKVIEVSSVDMFPWTPHVEVIVYLERI